MGFLPFAPRFCSSGLEERATENRKVIGSNPIGTTKQSFTEKRMGFSYNGKYSWLLPMKSGFDSLETHVTTMRV